MNTQDWFALRAFLNENGDSLNGFIELCASALIDTYFNDPHAAADKWSELLDRYGSVSVSYTHLTLPTKLEV